MDTRTKQVVIDGVLISLEDAFSAASRKCQAGEIAAGKRIYSDITRQYPENARAIHALGYIAAHFGNDHEAATLMKRALSIQPDFFDAHSNLGNILFRMGNMTEAAAHFQDAVALAPNNSMAHSNLGIVLRRMGRMQESEEHHRVAVSLENENPRHRALLAVVLQEQCKQEEAVQQYQESLRIKPDPEIHSDLLLVMNYLPSVSIQDILQESRRWGRYHGEMYSSLRAPFNNIPDKNRRLRIGYVSADFRQHPVGMFLLPVLASHTDAVESFCYSGVKEEDSMTSRLRSNADCWRPTAALPDIELISLIRSDGIDILVDLSGHTKGNRLPVFTAFPAPVQMTWAGYVGTVGMDAIDYLISDWYQTPEGFDEWYVERVERLHHDYICYEPPSCAPPVGLLPALQNGYLTFGCFNNVIKVNFETVRLWSAVLARIPDVRFVLGGSASLMDASVQDRFLGWFRRSGFHGEVRFFGKLPHQDLLAAYSQIDIGLDCFPYSGGLTTLESLWMGVPVITKIGDRFCSRHSLSHLANTGLRELAADSDEDYVEVALALAEDLDLLADIRRNLRVRMAGSPLCDKEGFTRGLENMYRTAWVRWCDGLV